MRPAPVPLALAALALLALAAAARADVTQAEASTLDRAEGAVVVTGERLEEVLGAPLRSLRLYALRDGALRPIPYQLDERTPEGGYAFTGGEERRSDTDDGHLDANDELVFMARHVGGRLGDWTPLPGEVDRLALHVTTPERDRGGWVYLLRFEGEPPPRASEDLVSLTWSGPDVTGWAGARARVVSAPSAAGFLDLRELRFARPGGGYGPDVLDRLKVGLEARYLFLDIARREDEVRSHVVGFLDGPVRVIARVVAETYLIWGHWVRTTPRTQVVIYEDRVELDLEVRVPVALEQRSRSGLRVALDFSPDAGDLAVWADALRRPLRPGRVTARDRRDAQAATPTWVCASSREGSLLLRFEPGPEAARLPRALHLEDGPAPDAPEDVPGSLLCAGFHLDLTALLPGTYRARFVLQLGPPLQPGAEGRLLLPDAAPLAVEVGPP
ncbi:MAG: hypothetical protein M9894_31305 [Planctomycetes bacterium]|nr:hypothetical protein [Planctomycetota bacterium]